jgi:hypothetical protein
LLLLLYDEESAAAALMVDMGSPVDFRMLFR